MTSLTLTTEAVGKARPTAADVSASPAGPERLTDVAPPLGAVRRGGAPSGCASAAGVNGDTAPAATAGGVLGVSGVSVAQVSRLQAALAPLRTVHHHHRDDWVTLWLSW